MPLPTQREYLRVLEKYGSYLAKKIDEGKMFKVFEKETIVGGGVYEMLIDNSLNTKDVMIAEIIIDSNKSLDVDILEGITVTNNGTELNVKSFNVGDNVSTNVKVYKAPTYSNGTIVDGGYIAGNTGVRAIGGEEELFLVTKIRAGEKIIIKITNLDATNDALVKIKVVFHEVE